MGRATARMVWTRSDPFQTSSFRRGVASIFFSLACCRRRAANGPRIAISLGKFAFFASPGDARPWTRNRSRATRAIARVGRAERLRKFIRNETDRASFLKIFKKSCCKNFGNLYKYLSVVRTTPSEDADGSHPVNRRPSHSRRPGWAATVQHAVRCPPPRGGGAMFSPGHF